MAKNKPASIYDNVFKDLLDLTKKYVPVKASNIDEEFRNSDIESIKKRDKIYINFISDYNTNFNKKSKGQRKMKWIFFITILTLLFGLIFGTVYSLIIISNKANVSINDISIIISSLVGAITAFIALPKIIANNLFPVKDEDHSADIFKSVIDNDLKLRQFHHISVSRNINENEKNDKHNQIEKINDDY